MDDQVVGTDDYSYRLEDEPLTIGCDHGGIASVLRPPTRGPT